MIKMKDTDPRCPVCSQLLPDHDICVVGFDCCCNDECIRSKREGVVIPVLDWMELFASDLPCLTINAPCQMEFLLTGFSPVEKNFINRKPDISIK